MNRGLAIVLILLLYGLGACDSTGTSAVAAVPTASIVTPTRAPTLAAATATAIVATPTKTATPPVATATPTPTKTVTPPVATATPTPTSTPTDAAPPAPAGAAAEEAQLFALVNELRAANGLPPYGYLAALSDVARAHSCDLALHGMISHISSDGRSLGDRIAGIVPAISWPSESIAAGTSDPAVVIALWLDEPPDGWHRRNLLDPDQQLVGIGYCVATEEDPSGNHFYWTMDIGR